MCMMGRPKERFCKRGHDTEEVGRVRKGWCKSCAYLADATGGINPQKPRQTPEWERARVHRWLEIAASDPLQVTSNTHKRKKEFDIRYERLEAGVPTP